MDRQLIAAALRILNSAYASERFASEDVDLLRENVQPEERDLNPDDLARLIVWRFVKGSHKG